MGDARTSSGPSTGEQEAFARLRGRVLGPAADELGPGSIVGRYRLLRPLGSGGMGEVWLADDPQLARRVAVKLLHLRRGRDAATAATRLLREAQAIAQIAHPNVVAIYDAGTIDGRARTFLAMEYVDGEPLDAWLTDAPRTAAEILAVFVAAGRGLAAAHRAHQIHRDFKPANVMIGRDGVAKVLDFGLVLIDGDWPSGSEGSTERAPRIDPIRLDSARLTESGVVMGTPRYMSPEQHVGGVVTSASDQFSYCCALLEALQGARPFAGRNAAEIGRAKLRGAIDRSGRTVEPRLRAVLERGLAREPDARWSSMDALLAELGPRRRSRRAWLLGGAVAVVGAIASAPADDPCAGKHSTWSDERAERAIARLADGDDLSRAQHLGEGMRAYESDLAAHEAATCVAHRSGALADVAFDRRVACLADRRDDLEAAATVLEQSDVRLGETTDAMVRGLPDLAPCGDDERLALAVAPPDDAATALAVDRARTRVATGRALMLAGKHREAIAVFEDARTDLASVDYPPMQAEIEMRIGRAGVELRDPTALDTLERALSIAEASGHDIVAAEAACYLIAASSQDHAQHERALALIPRADALARRAGDPTEIRALYWRAVGALHGMRGDFDESLAAAERAHALFASVLEPDDPSVVAAKFNLGVILRAMGRFDDAMVHHREVVEIRERTLGPAHRSTIFALNDLADDYAGAGRLDEAEATLRDSLARAEDTFGPAHDEVIVILDLLGRVVRKRGRGDEARAILLRALAIAEQLGTVETLEGAVALSNLAMIELRIDRLDDARVHIERAIPVLARLRGAEHYQTVRSRQALGWIELHAGNADRARAVLVDVVAAMRDIAAVDPAELAQAQRQLANAYLDLERVGDARAELDGIAATASTTVEHRVLAARVALADGDVSLAIEGLRAAVAQADEPAVRGLAELHLGAALRTAGDAGATAAFDRARSELEAAGDAGRHGRRLLAAMTGA